MRGSDIGGIAVHAAAPVMAQCQSNEILVSLGRDRPCRRRGPEVLRRSSGRHVKPGASEAATGYRDIVPRGGRRTLAGKTEYRSCRSHRRRSSCATSAETSCDHFSEVLKETTRIGLLYCPSSKSTMTVSRSVF